MCFAPYGGNCVIPHLVAYVTGANQQQITTIAPGTGAFLKTSIGTAQMATAQQLQPRIAPQTGAGVMGPGGIQDPKKATSGGNLMDKPLHMAVPPVAARLAPPTVPMSPAMQHPGAHQNQSPQTPEHLQVSWPSVKNE